jgi:hypothetical protein
MLAPVLLGRRRGGLEQVDRDAGAAQADHGATASCGLRTQPFELLALVRWRQASSGIAGADATPERPTSAQPSSALISALLTEHYTLQSTRGSTITEANGRSSQFLSAVSGATAAKELLPLRRPSGARRLLRACPPANSQLLLRRRRQRCPALLAEHGRRQASIDATHRAATHTATPLDAPGDRGRCGHRHHRRCSRRSRTQSPRLRSRCVQLRSLTS